MLGFPMIALADCAVVVSDAQQAAQWWSEKLGFAVHRVGAGGHAVMIAPPGDRFVVHLCSGFAPVEPGNTGIAFVTDEIEGMVARMQAGGVEFPEPMRKEPWGGIAKFADPDGNVFWLLGASSDFILEQRSLRAADSARGPARRPRSERSPSSASRRRKSSSRHGRS